MDIAADIMKLNLVFPALACGRCGNFPVFAVLAAGKFAINISAVHLRF
jgi:hypothetical protein